MKILDNKELEYKYNAYDISLTAFIAFAKSRNPTNSLYVCGYDHFYSSRSEPDTFIRHRVGDNFNQLTVKRKLTDKNNFIRDEINLSLAKDVTEETAASLAKSLGYEFNRTIFKTVFVYTYDKYVLSYYAVTDTELKELGRFMEIEVAEGYPWSTEDQAWSMLNDLECEAASSLGIKARGRIKKSLYEQFRKELK